MRKSNFGFWILDFRFMLPSIYIFNPTCELAIANGSPYYTPPARLRKFENDLSFLPAWLGEEKDQVLVHGSMSSEFRDRMCDLGFRLPETMDLDEALKNPDWISNPKSRLAPWGWSPTVYQLFKNVMPSFCADFQQSPVGKWQDIHKKLYSRLTAINLLDSILQKHSANWLPDYADLPVVCCSLEQIHKEVNRGVRTVVKTPWSSSGRGLLLFPNIDSAKKNDEILSGMLNQQNFVTVEPWLTKVMDLSYQFISNAGTIRYVGRTIFETDQKGRYVRNLLTDSLDEPTEAGTFLAEHDSEVVSILLNALSVSGYATHYEGWIGVDALVSRTSRGTLKFHPMIEINGRFTMGAIALKIREYLAPNSSGFMQMYYSKSINFHSFCQKMEAEKPLIMENQKIVSGFLPLTPPSAEHYFGGYIDVKNS